MHIIGGKFKKRALVSPNTETVRPTTGSLRETLFNICRQTVEDARFLDLFAGSGAMGLEAISRNAKLAVFVENNRSALAAIKKNIASLQVEGQCRLYPMDVFKALLLLVRNEDPFDIIYADPPYGKQLGGKVLEFIETHPQLLAKEGSLFIEDTALKEPTLHNLKLHREKKAGNTRLLEYRFLNFAPLKKI